MFSCSASISSWFSSREQWFPNLGEDGRGEEGGYRDSILFRVWLPVRMGEACLGLLQDDDPWIIWTNQPETCNLRLPLRNLQVQRLTSI